MTPARPLDEDPDAATRRLLRRRRWAEAVLWLLPAIWSSNYLIARSAGPWVPPHLLAFGRWFLVAAALLAWRGPALWRQRAVLRAEAGQLLVLGALGMWICGAWVYLAGVTTTVTNIGLIYAAAPVGIAIGSARLLGERISRPQAVGTVLALAGVVFVVLRGDLERLRTLAFGAGDLWILAATLSWIAYSLLLRRWPTRLNAMDRLCATALAGLLCLAPFTLVEWRALTQPLAGTAYALIGTAALLPGLVSYLAYGYLQRELGAARAALGLYLAPVYGAMLAWLLLGEAPQWYHAIGAVLILPGIYLSGRRAAR